MMRSRLSPTACLDFEPDEAKELVWLPLGVRFKLDEAALRLRLGSWQSLPHERRLELLTLPAGDEFRIAALLAGATRHEANQPPMPSLERIAEVLGCGLMRASSWLVDSSAFSRYVLAHRAGRSVKRATAA